nr:TniB family NTP-binding protein [Mesorhizobium sp. AR07]
MSTDTVHLTQAAKDLLGEPDIVRVSAIQARRWIFYPRAKQALDRLNLLVDHPRGTRMPSVAIYGDSGMGKTMIWKNSATTTPPVLIRRPAYRLYRSWQSR